MQKYYFFQVLLTKADTVPVSLDKKVRENKLLVSTGEHDKEFVSIVNPPYIFAFY